MENMEFLNIICRTQTENELEQTNQFQTERKEKKQTRI